MERKENFKTFRDKFNATMAGYQPKAYGWITAILMISDRKTGVTPVFLRVGKGMCISLITGFGRGKRLQLKSARTPGTHGAAGRLASVNCRSVAI